MAKKDFAAALHKTAKAQDKAVDDRFAAADSVLLNGKPPVVAPTQPKLPAASAGPATVTDSSQLVTRDTFSMPSGDYGLIEQLRVVAARQGRNTNKSEVVRAGLRHLLTLKPEQLVELLDGLEKVKPGRK